MPTDDFVPQLSVTLNGVELADDVYDRLVSVRAECSIQLPDEVTLTFLDEDFELYDRPICGVGDQVAVSISSSGQPVQVADCDVTAISVEPGSGDGPMLVVTALGADHRLASGVGIETFVNQTDSAIVSSIASAAGLQADVDSTSASRPYVVRAGPADRFLDERAALLGYRWWVGGRTLHFKREVDTSASATITWGVDILSLRVLTSTAEAAPNVTVRSWDPATQSDLVGEATPTSSVAKVGTDAPGPTAIVAAGRTDSRADRFVGSVPVDSATDANTLATAVADRASATAVRMRATVLGNPAIVAGRSVTVAGAGTRLCGDYHVATVVHEYTASEGYVTHLESGGQDADGLVDLLRTRPHRPPWNPNALLVGVVTNNDTSNGDGPTRVKVRFPSLSGELESAWARLVLPGAGASAGLLIHPDVDDEVLVGFEDGDPTRPVVLGGMWSGASAPPVEDATAVDASTGLVVVRTWKSKAGHSITIRDGAQSDPDAVIIELADQATRLTLAQDRVVLETPSDLTITTSANATVSADGDVSISGNNVSIEATQSLTLQGVELSAKGTQSAALEGATVDVKGNATLTLDGGPMTQVKGGQVLLN